MRTPIRVLLLLAAALAGACGDAAEPPRPPAAAEHAPAPDGRAVHAAEIPEDAPVVAFLGDSLAAGRGLAADEAFPAVLQRRLARRGLAFRLVNAGVSGSTTSGGLARVDWILAQDPDVVVIELGANDGFRGVPVETVAANLRAIVAKVREHGAQPMLLGIRLPPSYGPEYAAAFDALYARVAEDTGVPFVPFFMEGVAGVPGMNQADGIHPTAEGHRRLAANLEDALASHLDDA